MRMKFVKKGTGNRPGPLYKKTFYEYQLLSDDERKQLTENYTRSLKAIDIQSRTNKEYILCAIPPIRVPKPSQGDIDECELIHQNKGEEVIKIVKKNNDNIQIYVKVEIADPADPLLCTICNKFKAGSTAGLGAHQRSCKITNS